MKKSPWWQGEGLQLIAYIQDDARAPDSDAEPDERENDGDTGQFCRENRQMQTFKKKSQDLRKNTRFD